MVAVSERRAWLRRLRWRLRGAWQWPTFAVVVLAEGVLLDRLPVAGDAGPGVVAGILLAALPNLALLAVGGRLGGRLVRRRDASLPKVVADDRAATALLVAGLAVVVAVGIAHRPSAREQAGDLRAQAAAARRYVLSQAPLVFRAHVDAMDTWQQGPDLYRTCVPGGDPRHALCVIVDTRLSPPGVALDPDQRPNTVVSGPGNPGRRG
jgi:hypothetical protein